MNKTVVNTFFYSIGEILPRIISFLLLPIYTHYLSPADFGVISYTSTITMFLNVIGLLALNSYVLRFYFIYKDEKSRQKVISTAYLSIGVFNLTIMGLAFLFMPNLIEQYDIQVAWNPYFKLTIITNLLTCFSAIPLCFYRVKQQAHKYVILNFSRTIVTVSLNLFLIIGLKQGLNGYFYAHLYAAIPFVPIYFWIIGKYSGLIFSLSFLKEGLKYSLPLVPGTLAYIIINMSDRIILERNVSLGVIGLYNIAVTISNLLNVVISSGYHAFEPDIYSRYGENGYYDFVRKIQTIFFSAIFLIGLLISLFSQEVFYFFTSTKFHQGYIYMPILIFTAMISGQNVIYGSILQGDRKSKTVGGITLVGALFSITFNLLLIPYFGVWAAAITGSLSLLFMNILEFIFMKFPQKNIWRELFLSLLVVVLSYAIFSAFPIVSWMGLLIKVMIIIFYITILCLIYNLKINNVKDVLSLVNIKR